MNNGALGGKLLGAGGGGFIFLFFPEKKQKKFFKKIKHVLNVPFNFSDEKSQIILNN